MKPKQIPRTIKIWLFALGLFWGIVTSSVLLSIGYFAYGSLVIGALLIAIGIIGSMLFLWVITWKAHKTLEEWGIITPKKEKKKA